MNINSSTSLTEQAAPFYTYLDGWTAALPTLHMDQLCQNPETCAVICVDITRGFCYEGPLSSPRVAGIVEPILKLFLNAWEHGVRSFVLPQDTHAPDAVEFAQWPAHCVRGTTEAETVPELTSLPFFDQVVVLEKNSISSGIDTGLEQWMAAHPQVDTFIVTGDCTDLCTYQLAMQLRLDANARQLTRRVIVPADCVQTYDLPLEAAQSLGAMPHPGDLLHAVFLYHMALNGVEVAAKIL